jgi:hypothetical protein
LAYQASHFKPQKATTTRWLAGGVVAEDEAKIFEEMKARGEEGSSEEEEETAEEEASRLEAEAKRKAKPKQTKGGEGGGGDDEVLVYDHHGDTFDHPTKQAYLSKNYTLYYEVCVRERRSCCNCWGAVSLSM